MKIDVIYQVSEKVIAKELIETGVKEPLKRTVTFNLTELDKETRQKLVELDAIRLGEGMGTESQQIDITKYNVVSPRSLGRIEDVLFEFDAEPTINQVIEFLQKRKTARDEIDADKKARDDKYAEEVRQERIDRKKFAQIEAAEKKKIDELQSISDYESLNTYRVPAECDIDNKFAEAVRDRLYGYRSSACYAIRKELAEAERERWAAEHGSDRLKKGVAEGYDCKRLYTIERAAKEAPGWIVDYNETANDRERACPTLKALILADKARALNLGTPEIVWLTSEPTNDIIKRTNDDYSDYREDDEFDPCEAIKIRDFLGEDLYLIVDSADLDNTVDGERCKLCGSYGGQCICDREADR